LGLGGGVDSPLDDDSELDLELPLLPDEAFDELEPVEPDVLATTTVVDFAELGSSANGSCAAPPRWSAVPLVVSAKAAPEGCTSVADSPALGACATGARTSGEELEPPSSA
jgi:hypothetical protein